MYFYLEGFFNGLVVRFHFLQSNLEGEKPESPWGRPQVELSVSRDHVITGIELMIFHRFLPIFFCGETALTDPKKGGKRDRHL